MKGNLLMELDNNINFMKELILRDVIDKNQQIVELSNQ
jgi:hypothetical protein